MKHSEFRKIQEDIEPLTKYADICIYFGKMKVQAKVADRYNTGLRFTRNVNSKEIPGYVELSPDVTHIIKPDELRWMADVWDHFKRWLDDKEDWPLPQEPIQSPEAKKLIASVPGMSDSLLQELWEDIKSTEDIEVKHVPGLTTLDWLRFIKDEMEHRNMLDV